MKLSRLPDIVAWELDKGETATWIGTPEIGPFVLTTTRWSRMFLGIPAFGVGVALAPVSPPLGFVFLIASMYMLLAPIGNLLKGMRTIYVITNRRLIVIERLPGFPVTSFSGDAINNIERKDYSGGTGSLVFSRKEISVSRSDGFDHRIVERKGFFGIRDVTFVWRLMMALKNGELTSLKREKYPHGISK